MNDHDDDRDAILARRARLIALALGGLTALAGCEDATPEPCLSDSAVDVGDAGPGPCLSDAAR